MVVSEFKSFKNIFTVFAHNNKFLLQVKIGKSGNCYNYNCLLNIAPTESQVFRLWETQRKYWTR